MRIIYFLALTSLLISSACVMKTQHDQVLAKNLRMESELTGLKAQATELRAELRTTKERASELETRNQELSHTNQILSSRNSNFSRQCVEAQKELLQLKQEKSQAEEKVEFVTQTYDDLVNTLKDEIAVGQVAIAEKGDRLTVNVADQVLFASGSDRIQSEGKKVLKKVAQILKDLKGKRIEVEGHTDNVPIKGGLTQKFPTNWELSAARATKVVRFLEKSGVAPGALAAVGYGEHRPMVANDSATNRRKNRRIDIVLLPRRN